MIGLRHMPALSRHTSNTQSPSVLPELWGLRVVQYGLPRRGVVWDL